MHGRFDMDREMSDERFNLGLVSTLVDSSSNGNPNPADTGGTALVSTLT